MAGDTRGDLSLHAQPTTPTPSSPLPTFLAPEEGYSQLIFCPRPQFWGCEISPLRPVPAGFHEGGGSRWHCREGVATCRVLSPLALLLSCPCQALLRDPSDLGMRLTLQRPFLTDPQHPVPLLTLSHPCPALLYHCSPCPTPARLSYQCSPCCLLFFSNCPAGVAPGREHPARDRGCNEGIAQRGREQLGWEAPGTLPFLLSQQNGSPNFFPALQSPVSILLWPDPARPVLVPDCCGAQGWEERA